jgi:hypothetical protein
MVVLIGVMINYSTVFYWTSQIAAPVYWTYQSRDLSSVRGPGYNIRHHASVGDRLDEILAAKTNYLALMDEYFGAALVPPLVIAMEKGELNRQLGDGYSLESAGAYQSGVVLIGVDSNVSTDSIVSTLVHEMGHHYVHILARGNYPVWYTEGIAQLMEYTLLGRLWFDGIQYKDYYKYSMAELTEDFYGLNQVSAYRQAFDLVLTIEKLGGGQANQQILRDLGRGSDFAKAVESHTGLDPDRLYEHVFGMKIK